MTNTATLTLADLYLHDLNPRAVHLDAEVEAKARSIQSVGLIQNLAGYRDPARDGVGIVAGGYRLLGLQLIASGELGPAEVDLAAIRVEVTDDPAIAEAWAVAENVAQVPLSPAEEIRAYGKMARDTGADPNTIARAFAVTEVHVKRRLKLADLPDPILDGLAAREITLDMAQLFTTAESPEQAREVYETARRDRWNEYQIKRALHGDRISGNDRRVRFIGLDRLEAEGIGVQRSLFSDDSWITCAAERLDELFMAELERLRGEVEGEGWAFVWASDKDQGWAIRESDPRMKGMEEIDPEPVELPAGDQERLDELSGIPTYQMNEAEAQELAELIARERGGYTEEQLAAVGCMIYVDPAGEPRSIQGIRKREKAEKEEAGTPVKPASPAVPDAVKDDLAKVALHARQRALLGRTELVVDLLAYQLAEDRPDWKRLFALAPSPLPTVPEKAEGMQPSERLAWPERNYSGELSPEGFAAFQAKGKKHRNTVLTERLAALLTHAGGDLAEVLNGQTQPDVRAIWTPGYENFFGRLRAPALDAIEAELLHDADEEKRAAFAKMKVKEKARELSDLFESAEVREAWGLSREQATRLDNWIPTEMRDHLKMPAEAGEQEAA